MRSTFSMKSGDLGDAARKRNLNRVLFADVAPRYDTITRVMSLWRDAGWKRALIASIPEQERPNCLDLACGTGDICAMVAGRFADADVTGLDLTPEMLELARARNENKSIDFVQGDMTATELPSTSFDLITGSYALRNAPDLNAAVAEVHRLLKPGAHAAFLDFSKPKSRFLQWFEHLILKFWGSVWGIIYHGNPQVYGYIADSLKRFPDRVTLHKLFEQQGFCFVSSRLFYFGVIEVFVVQKKESSDATSG